MTYAFLISSDFRGFLIFSSIRWCRCLPPLSYLRRYFCWCHAFLIIIFAILIFFCRFRLFIFIFIDYYWLSSFPSFDGFSFADYFFAFISFRHIDVVDDEAITFFDWCCRHYIADDISFDIDAALLHAAEMLSLFIAAAISPFYYWLILRRVYFLSPFITPLMLPRFLSDAFFRLIFLRLFIIDFFLLIDDYCHADAASSLWCFSCWCRHAMPLRPRHVAADFRFMITPFFDVRHASAFAID